jgi:hypothetical protein
MAKRRASMKRSTVKHTKTSRTKRGGNWFQDIGEKIKNEFVNPRSLLRNEVLNAATNISRAIPTPLSPVIEAANTANTLAKSVGLGRKKKYIKYIKSKSHGKRNLKK